MSDETAQTPGTPKSDDGEGVTAPEPQIEPAVSASDHVSLGSTAPDSDDEAIPELVEPVDAEVAPADVRAAVVVPAEPEPELVTEPELVAEPEAPESRQLPEEPVVAAPAEPRAVQTVFVREPTPPVRKGNRAVGSLIALGSALVFALLYAVVVVVVMPLFAPPRATAFEFLRFVNSSAFFIPVLVFAVLFVLLAIVLNRAGWWAYILGSLLVGILVYAVSIGVLLLLNNVIGMTPSAAARAFRAAAESPLIITAALVAREVSLWMGAAIAARGRRVKVRNAEARAAFDSDSARARAEYERAVAANASA